MRKTLAVSLFVLATFTWTFAQSSGSSTPGSQPPSASSQTPDASQSQSPSGSAGQSSPGAQSQSPSQANAPITEGCLGGSNGSYTLTDNAGKTYKLSFPANANVSVLSSHVGESVAVMGDTQGSGNSGQTINVSKIGRGTTTCPGSSSGSSSPSGSSAQPQTPKK
jgi:hypothetical protein